MKVLTNILIVAAMFAAYPVCAQTNPPTDWNSQNIYWQNAYPSTPYFSASRDYSAYEPAYHYGVELYNQNAGKPYDQLDQALIRSGWAGVRGNSNLDWSDAQLATRDAYNHINSIRNSATSATPR